MEQVFMVLDVHKKTIQMSVMGKDGEEVLNKSKSKVNGRKHTL